MEIWKTKHFPQNEKWDLKIVYLKDTMKEKILQAKFSKVGFAIEVDDLGESQLCKLSDRQFAFLKTLVVSYLL